MSIAIGVYDFFSYTIPGILYIYIIYELIKLFKLDMLDQLSGVADATTPIQVAIMVFGLVVAFIAGHVFDMLARALVFRIMYRKKTSEEVLNKIKNRDRDANIQFEAKDWHILLVLLRQRNLQVALSFDKHEADSIMFRNISLIALLSAFIMGAKAIIEHPTYWIAVAASLLIWIMAARRSFTLHTWFFEGIFLAALEYGNSVQKALEYDTSKNSEHLVRIGLLRRDKKEDAT